MRYKQNLHVEGNKVISYTTHVATIDREAGKLFVHGWWSVTTSKHINHVADTYGLVKEDRKLEETNKPETDNLKTIGLIAGLGDLFSSTPEESNTWKKRMLNAGLAGQGLEFPEDFDKLPEEEKTRRLNGAIAELK